MGANLNKNSDVKRPNADKMIEYPEHKWKNREGIVLQDFNKNVTIFDNTKDFYNKVKEWEKDQFSLNFDRTHHKNRTISIERLNEKLDNKSIATTYTLQENALFFKQKFNDDPNLIKEFYTEFLNCFLEEAGIPKNQLINAIIHFDQTNPHLHFAISNIHPRFSKDLKREVLTVNKNTYHLLDNLLESKKGDERWLEMKRVKNAYYNKEINEGDWNTYLENNWDVGLLSNVEKRLNQKWEQKYGAGLYLSSKDKIYMQNIRGFSNQDILDISRKREMTEKYIKMQNNIILKSRETTYNAELFNFKYKKHPSLNKQQIEEYEEYLSMSIDNELFEEYVRHKYNKLFSDFVIQMNNDFNYEQKKNFCEFLKINFNVENDMGFLKAISSINELYQLREIADIVGNIIAISIEDETKLENMDSDDKALTNTFLNWFSKTNHDLLNDIILEVRELEGKEELNSKTIWMICHKTSVRLNKAITQLENDVDIYNKLQKNWYFKYEHEQMKKRFDQAYNVELNKIEPKMVRLDLNPYEKRLMFKKVLQERIDFDLKMLNLYSNFEEIGLNSIERMREYNKVLSYCAHIQFEKKQQWELARNYLKQNSNKLLEISQKDILALNPKDQTELDKAQQMYNIYKSGADYTPQILARKIYEREWTPLDYEKELENINTSLSNEEKEIEIIKIENLKEIEYAILNTHLSFNELKEQYKLEKSENKLENYDFKKYEQEYLEEHVRDLQFELKINSRDLAHEAKEINNWFEIENLEEDLALESKRNWKDDEVEHVLEMLEENQIYFDKLEEEQEFLTAGINIDFINKLNDDLTLEMVKNNFQSQKQNQEQLLIQRKDNDRDSNALNYNDLTISEKYAPFFVSNEQGLANISRNAKRWVLEVKLNHIVALAKKGHHIDELCKEIEIDPKYVKYQIRKAKELKKERDEEIVEMTLGR